MNIPDFPNFRPFAAEDKNLFDSIQEKGQPKISDYTFANFFIWRIIDGTMLTKINGNVCTFAHAPDRMPYFMMPQGDIEVEDTLRKCLTISSKVIRLSEEFVTKHKSELSCFLIEEDRDNFDYIYLVEDLRTLKGKKFDGKRNHINHFLKNNTFEYQLLSAEHIEECLVLNEKWCTAKKKESEAFPNLECEAKVVDEILCNMQMLDVRGGVIKTGGEIKAFSIGQRLNKDTGVVHVEKYDPDIRGLSQLINREFARHAWNDIVYMNREQDLGHPGLRKAKMSYHPVILEKKYNLSLKESA